VPRCPSHPAAGVLQAVEHPGTTVGTLRQLVRDLTWAERLREVSTWFDGTTLVW
jgi:hypothetical protein